MLDGVTVDELIGLPAGLHPEPSPAELDRINGFLIEPSPDEMREVLDPQTKQADRPNTSKPRKSRVATAEDLANYNPYATDDDSPRSPLIRPERIGDMVRKYPDLRPIVVDGMLRKGETMNLIAPSKVGKSWLAYSLALSVVMGRDWLDTFACMPGKVLLIDNELHPETIAHRLPVVADALGIKFGQYECDLHVVSLRGRLLSLTQLDRVFDGLKEGEYQLVIGDAWYRFIPSGVSENDNAQVMGLYNQLDQYVSQADCAWCGIHHTSKGAQGEKSVVDTGSGAGAQARAADAHVVMRPHEDDGIVVLESALRSFKPQAPLALRWAFPLWIPDGGADPSLLKGRLTKGEKRTQDRHAESIKKIVDALREGPKSRRKLMGKTKLSRELCQTLLDRLEADEQVTFSTTTIRGNETREYSLKDVGDE